MVDRSNYMDADAAQNRLKKMFGNNADLSSFKDLPSDTKNYNAALQEAIETNAKDGKGNSVFNRKGLGSLGRSSITNADALLNTKIGGLGFVLGRTHLDNYLDMAKRDANSNAGKFTFGPSLAHGYNQGMNGAIAASNVTHGMNAIAALNPFGSFGESMLNANGITTKAQRTAAIAGGRMAKATTIAIPGMVAAMSISQMMHGDDAGDIIMGNSAIGFMQTGFRMGKGIGGMMTKEGSTVARMVGMGVGGVVGAAAFLAGTQGLYEGAKDMASNESSIAKAARHMYKRESMVNTQETRETLTARQRNFQKLSASGMNDRMSLLGNEALSLRNLA